MHDVCTILAKEAAKTRLAGASLASTLYALPVTIALTGELGAGKTTFLQGFAAALGIQEPLVSPTYALEQRYRLPRHSAEFLHLDLYRLTPQQARDLLRSSEDAGGIRCIEWSERVTTESLRAEGPVIHVHIEEGSRAEGQKDGSCLRRIRCSFHDAALPTDQMIRSWRTDALLPAHIIAHCEAVASLAVQLGEELVRRGSLVRLRALRRAAQIHDLLRFLDFRPGGHPDNDHPPATLSRWDEWRSQFPGFGHEAACSAFLRQEGFPVIADIVEPHGLTLPPPERRTVEQQLLFYADKRVMMDTVVTLDERFEDFAQRYGKGKWTEHHSRWYEEAKRVERELFPDGIAQE